MNSIEQPSKRQVTICPIEPIEQATGEPVMTGPKSDDPHSSINA